LDRFVPSLFSVLQRKEIERRLVLNSSLVNAHNLSHP
jgi:hypothetical protein